MAQITYANKVALNVNPEIADINKVTDSDMNMIRDVVNQNDTKLLVAVSSAAPDTCSTGDVYFNTTDNLLYAAIATNTWGSAGLLPTFNTIYAVISDRELYLFNGTTLVKVSGNSDFEPIGKVIPMALSTAPDGYLLCDGSTYTKSAYPDLYNALIGTSFIVDANSFTVPNIKGKVIVGLDSNDTDFDTLGETGGSKELQEHSHQIKGFRNTINGTGETIPVASFRNSDDDAGGAYTRTEGTGNSGNLQPYIVLNYFIKAQKLSGDVVLSESLPVGTVVEFDGQASDIPVGWEQIDTYSTSEVKTGQNWINGKPIYRKVFEINSYTPSTTSTISISSLNMDKLVNISGMTYDGTQHIPIPFANQNNEVNYVYRNGNSISYYLTYGTSATLTLEYTKTTD